MKANANSLISTMFHKGWTSLLYIYIERERERERERWRENECYK